LLQLHGKAAVITASYGDIGRATCRRFGQEGAMVIMTGRKPVVEGAALAQGIPDEAGDESDYITGAALLVDGGASIWRRS